MGITHVVRGSEYLSSAPKYNLLYQGFGWEVPAYIHCSPVMRDQHSKMSKRKGDPSYEDLLAMGYLSEAVVNYVTLLGWSPKGEDSEREFFTLSELAGAFDVAGISKSPAIFDIEKLKYFNAKYLRALSPEDFYAGAEPYLKEAVRTPGIDLSLIAPLVQPRCDTWLDIAPQVDFFDALPEYSNELYCHKKMKTNEENSLEALQLVLPVLEALPEWSYDAIHDALIDLAAKHELKNGAHHVAGTHRRLRQSRHPRRRGGAVPHSGPGGDSLPHPEWHGAALPLTASRNRSRTTPFIRRGPFSGFICPGSLPSAGRAPPSGRGGGSPPRRRSHRRGPQRPRP